MSLKVDFGKIRVNDVPLPIRILYYCKVELEAEWWGRTNLVTEILTKIPDRFFPNSKILYFTFVYVHNKYP